MIFLLFDVGLHFSLRDLWAVVVTLPDEAAAAIVVATARAEAPHVPIIVRAATQEGVGRLFALGAQHVIYPELEGGLEMMRETLTHLGFSESTVEGYADAVRRDHRSLMVETEWPPTRMGTRAVCKPASRFGRTSTCILRS